MSTRLHLRVPASTSNLGPGFDLLGLALSLWLEVDVDVKEGEHEFDLLEGAASEWPRSNNLITRAFDAGLEALGQPARGLRLSARSEIPVGRGLGSSGAAVAAGLALAAHCADASRTDIPALLALGCTLEGHPDNSTASMLGGCTLALPHDGQLTVVHQELAADLGFAVAWPACGVSTAEARRVLPASVPMADAIENPRRLALLLEGLRRGDPQLLSLGIEDRLHVDRRLALIAGGAEALSSARAAGAWAATVSGSGSTLIALGPKGSMDPIAAAMAAALDAGDGPATGRVVEPVLGPPLVERLD